MMTANEVIAKAINIANNYKTLYVMGCYGAPLTPKNKVTYTHNHDYNRRAVRTKLINAASTDTFGFDCSGLIKAILWGWRGDLNHATGGAKYGSTVPDMNADTMIKNCVASTDFSKIVPGELLWTNGHIGIYIGNGMAVECTPSFDNKVQITTVRNIKSSGPNLRTWKKHGRFRFIDYSNSAPAPTQAPATKPTKTPTDIAKEVIAGKWGVMPERKTRIEQAGYNYNSVRAIVNRLMKEGK